MTHWRANLGDGSVSGDSEGVSSFPADVSSPGTMSTLWKSFHSFGLICVGRRLAPTIEHRDLDDVEDLLGYMPACAATCSASKWLTMVRKWVNASRGRPVNTGYPPWSRTHKASKLRKMSPLG